MKIAIVNGPNLNMLGKRNKDIYGTKTYNELVNEIKEYYEDDDYEFEFFQSNSEGEIIDFLQLGEDNFDGFVINLGAYTHYSYAIADCIEDLSKPCVEVHMSNIQAREEFRKTSVIAKHCVGTISGFGDSSYYLGILALAGHIG